ncbi:hypothetical protein GUJ93_ZPchr0009g1531 [Zizania palustris]|uniref:Uncharacterized protein n=1 Tax=Zizania palustris TaxID=103762 RepID=A0A8J5RKT2_ZIZPA|nr:hypothetical protein GUJ93_ZPchr0009g1531 [Zizania palustris]
MNRLDCSQPNGIYTTKYGPILDNRARDFFDGVMEALRVAYNTGKAMLLGLDLIWKRGITDKAFTRPSKWS